MFILYFSTKNNVNIKFHLSFHVQDPMALMWRERKSERDKIVDKIVQCSIEKKCRFTNICVTNLTPHPLERQRNIIFNKHERALELSFYVLYIFPTFRGFIQSYSDRT